MTTCAPTVFLLAYYRHHLNLFGKSLPIAEELAYALIPSDQDSWAGHVRFQTVSGLGRPLKPVLTSHYDLQSIRGVDIAAGKIDPAEQHLIEVLKGRAMAAQHVLPMIVPSEARPPWSKLPVSREILEKLRRAGGLTASAR
jgi:hypothetical protein